MKSLKDFEEDIYKCSRCALCQSVCPIYKVTLNECCVSKGKFNMLNGIIKGELAMTRQAKKYLDLCTQCNACKNFCPSGIDARKIFIAAKNEYYKKNSQPILLRFANSYKVFKTILFLSRIFFGLYRTFKLDKIVNILRPLILKTGILGKRLILLNSLASKNIKKSKKNKKNKQTSKKAIYFKGCFNQYINNDTELAVKDLLNETGVEFIEKDFECCGISYLHDGDIENFKKLAQINIKKLDTDADYIITDCASCFDVLKNYEEYIETKQAKDIAKKVITPVELLSKKNFKSKKHLKITIHKPCHENFDIEKFIKSVENLEYIQAQDYDKCCGFSGKFALQNQEISREISRRKAQQFIKTGADIILTTCPACILGLEQGLAETGEQNVPAVMNLFVFLAQYCTTR